MPNPIRRTLLLTAALAATAFAQKKFEVASIKPHTGDFQRVMIRMAPGGRFTATGVSLKMLITQAYDVRDFQVSGGPGWMTSDRYEINAKAEGDQERIPPEELRPMLQALLEDRFQLKVHRENKEMQVYALVPAKTGSKLKANAEGKGPMMRMGRGQLSGQKVPLDMLARQLAQQVGRPVLNKTGLTGEYDFTLEWTPEPGQGGGPFGGGPPPDAPPPSDSSGPSLFTALQEQLGLRLESQKGSAEMVVIDRVEKPSPN